MAALRRLVTDPVSGLAPAYQALDHARAQAAGIALCAFFAIASAFGAVFGAARAVGGTLSLASGQGFLGFAKLIVGFLTIPVAMTLTSYGVRKVFRTNGPLTADLFTCGVAVSPLGVAILLCGVLGIGNVDAVALVLMTALIYLVLMLFAGLTRIGGLSERAAAPTLPVMFLLTIWLAKVVFTGLLM